MSLDETSRPLIFNEKKQRYGSLDWNILNSPVKVIYCVHGKPSIGCCTVTGQIFSEGTDDESTTSQSIDNMETANLINEHCHRNRSTGVDKKARRKLIVASVLCVIFMIGEIIGGYLSSSLAIATDAAHLLTDFASFMISLFSLWVGSRPATRRMTFGWYRAEVIGALTSVLLIWVVTGILLYLAIERLINKNFEINAVVMLITSCVGVLVNLIMGLTLHQHGHSHGGGSSHGHSHVANNNDVEGQSKKEKQNINVRAAYIHVIGDFIQSFGVLVAAIIIYFKPEWNIVDPICTFLFSILVLFTTYAIIKDTLVVLMEGIPKDINFNEVMETFLKIEGVVKVHNLRIFALSLDKIALSAHLAIEPGVNPQNVLMMASGNIHDKYSFFEMTLQIEEFLEDMQNCKMCETPAD